MADSEEEKINIGRYNEVVREEWIQNVLKSLSPGLRILDAGAGEQLYRKFCDHLQYVAQDLGEYNGEGNTSGLQTNKWDYGKLDIISDIISIPEPDNSFDVILCSEVLEHIPEPILALKEFSRLLKSNGILILTAPFCSITHFAPQHYSTGFNIYWYMRHLENNGFKLKNATVNGNYFQYLGQELHRLSSIAKTYSEDDFTSDEIFAARIILKMLYRFSEKDKGSYELLNFGFFIVAEKT